MTGKRKDESSRARSPQNSPSPYDADESDSEELPSGYHQVSIQVGSSVSSWHEDVSVCSTSMALNQWRSQLTFYIEKSHYSSVLKYF